MVRSPSARKSRGPPCRGRVLVTGGAGFIGSHVVDQLVRAECGEVIVLDNFVRATRDNLAWAQAKGRVTLVEADIRRHDVIDKVVRRSDFVFTRQR
jgi:UDP-glucose 4-epimerase